MKTEKWKVYGFWILLTEAVGALAGFLTRSGTALYQETAVKPPLSPPGWAFPVVWTVLYALMGIGAARIWLSPPSWQRSRSLLLYAVQLFVNFFWSIWFFGLQAYGLAFVWILLLWVLILWMIQSFSTVDPLAARLQIPYLLWVTFAACLNLWVWVLNS